MANLNQTNNPFENEQPQLVHLEKDQSHYEYCRMQMHDIDSAHRRTFFFNLVICIAVSLLAVFQIYIGGFSLTGGTGNMHADLSGMERLKVVLTIGIFQIVTSMIIMALGYLAWANFRILNIILAVWYFIVTFIGILQLDYATGIVGAIGLVIYCFAVRENQKESVLSEMEGYPSFQERFDIQKSDIVVATLMAHKGEKRTKSTLFTTDYSLRRSKKRKAADAAAGSGERAGEALADTLKKHIDEVKGDAAGKSDAKDSRNGSRCYLTRMNTELQCIAADDDANGEEFPFRLALSEGDRVCVRDGAIYVNGAAYMPKSLNDSHHFRMRIAESGSRIRIAMSRISEAEYEAAVPSAEASAEKPVSEPAPAAEKMPELETAAQEIAEQTVKEAAEAAETAAEQTVKETAETAETAAEQIVKETAEAAAPAEPAAKKSAGKPAGQQQGGSRKKKKRR